MLLVLSMLGGFAVASAAEPDLPTDRYEVAGLAQPAEILIDRWGVPHLYARSQDDGFFLQGWNAARDRLWQLDLWKRRGDGTLAEALGPEWIDQDRAARLLLYRGDLYSEWLAYASDTKRIVTAFVRGINAFIELTEKSPELLPPEFTVLGYRPARWQPETVVRIRSHGLLRNVTSEVARAVLLRKHGPAALELGDWLTPAHELVVPAGLDLAWIDEGVLADYRLGTGGVSFAAKPVQAAAAAGIKKPAEPDPGSNNWALSPRKTSTGRPLLANDPHRQLTLPSLRYLVHLQAPGLDVIGAGEPALPGVSIGHNGYAAFGLTIFGIDQEDLYVYETHPEGAHEYRYQNRWEPMQIVTESVPVRGQEPVEVTLKFTRHGPVLHEDHARRLAYALRAAWLEPGMAPYLGSILYMHARSWDEFLAAMNRWGAPAENQVYADRSGAIGWKPGGRAPIRPNWDGLLPVPGDGRYEWRGFRDMDELPVEVDPERGFVASANQMNLPPGYPHALGFEWREPYRFERIVEVLGAGNEHDPASALRLQTDDLSIPARRLLLLIRDLEGETEMERRALTLLREWDCRLDRASAAAALFEVWWRKHLPAALYREIAHARTEVPEQAAEALAERRRQEIVLSLLEHPDARMGEDSLTTRTRALRTSLQAAMAEVAQHLGPDPQGWRWGDLHHAALLHPLSERLPPELRARTDIGPLPRSGSGDTVGNTEYEPQAFRQVSGASFRMVLDVGAWDQSLWMNSPGQSGDPRSPHYRDLFEPWASDQAFPLLYTRERILEATERRILLEPQK